MSGTGTMARARRSLAYRGWRRSLILLGKWTLFHLRHGGRVPPPPAFDLEFGLQTSALAPPAGERKGSLPGVSHGPADPATFGRLLRRAEIGAGEFAFLDFGCGQGRALLLASEYPFAQIAGVEYDRALVDAAQRNVESWTRRRSSRQLCRNIRVEWEDAAQWEFPVAPTIFFLNEPFYEPVMRAVAARIRASLRAAPRHAYVLYLGDWHRRIWEAPGDFAIEASAGDDRLYRWREPAG